MIYPPFHGNTLTQFVAYPARLNVYEIILECFPIVGICISFTFKTPHCLAEEITASGQPMNRLQPSFNPSHSTRYGAENRTQNALEKTNRTDTNGASSFGRHSSNQNAIPRRTWNIKVGIHVER